MLQLPMILILLLILYLMVIQNFDEILEKEGEDFLFSCWNKDEWSAKIEESRLKDLQVI